MEEFTFKIQEEEYYRSVIYDPMTAYFGSKCDIPKWLMNDQNIFDEI